MDWGVGVVLYILPKTHATSPKPLSESRLSDPGFGGPDPSSASRIVVHIPTTIPYGLREIPIKDDRL